MPYRFFGAVLRVRGRDQRLENPPLGVSKIAGILFVFHIYSMADTPLWNRL